MQTKRLFILVTISFGFLSGCASVKDYIKANIQKPKVKFAGVKIDRLSFDSLDLLFDLEVHNPNPAGIHLSELSYDLVLSGSSFLKGKQDQGLAVQARSKDIVQIPLSLNYSDIYHTFRSIKNRDSTDYEISAVLTFDMKLAGLPIRIPVKKTGTLPLLKPPKIKVASIELNRLSLSGADLNLGIRLINPNAFAFNLEELNYDFEVNSRPWLNANSVNKVHVPAKDEGFIEFPISLNFFQIGRSVYRLLKDGRPFEYRFKGDLKIASPLEILGTVNLPFDHSGEIELKRQ